MKNMDQIYQAHGRAVYHYLLTLTHNADAAEELTQETFYQAVKYINRYDGSCKITTWLCAIAKNQFFAWQRKQGRETELSADLPQEGSLEGDTLRRMEYLELLQKLHELEDPMREVLYLRLFGELSFKEIGAILNRTENWARVTFYRGKEKLRKELEPHEK